MTVRWRLRAFCAGLVGSALAALAAPASGLSPAALGGAATNPVAASTGGVSNVTFYYGGGTRLRLGEDLSTLGHPSIVVTTDKGSSGDSDSVAAIHSVGAKAYRYVQFYWAPQDKEYEGIDLQQHPEWAFCSSGQHKVKGRTTDGGATSWYFLDANEKGLRAHLQAVLDEYKAQGWDGVMFDRGEAATQYAKDINGNPIWYRRSTCTSDPYKPGATFADAYVNMLGLAHAAGLQTMMNNGKSPFDPVTRMRPDPTNVNCQRARWSRCRYLTDVWSKVDLILNEQATRPKDVSWQRTFLANQRSEANTSYNRRTVALITTGSLGGAVNQRRPNVFYAWSRIKLFDLAVSVNTGDGGCAGASPGDVCNRYGVYPELVDTVMGPPLSSGPSSQSCAKPSKIHCVWVRRYRSGADIVNAQGTARNNVPVDLGLANCRYVYDVYSQSPLAGDTCVKSLRMNLPAWSGRPLRYSTKPW